MRRGREGREGRRGGEERRGGGEEGRGGEKGKGKGGIIAHTIFSNITLYLQTVLWICSDELVVPGKAVREGLV